MCKNLMTHAQIKVTSWTADEKFAKNTSFVRKKVLTDFFTKSLDWFPWRGSLHHLCGKNGIMICNISKMICQIVPRPCFRTDLKVDRTRNRMRVAIESGKGMKVKVLKLCWNKWNGPFLMHIYFRDASGLNCYPHPISCHRYKDTKTRTTI